MRKLSNYLPKVITPGDEAPCGFIYKLLMQCQRNLSLIFLLTLFLPVSNPGTKAIYNVNFYIIISPMR